MGKTYFYKKKITAGTSELNLAVPGIVPGTLSLLNMGGVDVTIEFDNAIDADSIPLPPRTPFTVPCHVEKIYYKTATGSADVYVSGAKHQKS